MNSEAAVISAICENKDISSVLSGNIDEVFTSHRDVWEGLKSYYLRFKAVPDISILVEKFKDFEPVKIKGETAYYLDSLKNEYLAARLRNLLLTSGASLKTEASGRVIAQMQAELAKLGKLTSNVRDVDITDYKEAEKHFQALKDRSDVMGGSPGIRTGFKAIDYAYPTGMAPGHLIVMIGWPGKGKQEDVNKVIPTPTGYKRFGDLVPGDIIWGKDGETRVTATHPQESRKAMKVSFNDGTSTIVGPEHLWSIYCGKRGFERGSLVTMTTQEVLDRGLMRNRTGHKEYRALLPLPSKVEYSEKYLPLDPYTLGALLGDGAIGPTASMAILTCNDEFIAQSVIDNSPHLSISEHKQFSSRRWGIGKIKPILKGLGIDVKSHEKFIPEIYKTSSSKSRLSILRGLMDTDGSVSKNHRANFHSYNLSLSEDVAEIVRSLGGVAKVHSRTRANGDIEYRTSVWTPENPFLLPRKADNYSPKKWFKAISSIEICEDREMMCISVDSADSLYLTENYTVTHNTWFTSYLACKAWEQGFKPMVVSLEMTPENMRDRIYTMMGSGLFKASDFARGDINIDQFDDWGAKKFADKNQFILVSNEGMGEVTPNMIQGKIDQYKPDIVILDYHQLFSDNQNSKGPTERNMNISKSFKKLAMSNNIPIIDITAATAEEVADHDSPPMLSQVAWSKAIEYDADMAIAIHKNPDSNIMEIVSRKNRHGTEFGMYLDWDLNRGIVKEVYEVPQG